MPNRRSVLLGILSTVMLLVANLAQAAYPRVTTITEEYIHCDCIALNVADNSSRGRDCDNESSFIASSSIGSHRQSKLQADRTGTCTTKPMLCCANVIRISNRVDQGALAKARVLVFKVFIQKPNLLNGVELC